MMIYSLKSHSTVNIHLRFELGVQAWTMQLEIDPVKVSPNSGFIYFWRYLV